MERVSTLRSGLQTLMERLDGDPSWLLPFGEELGRAPGEQVLKLCATEFIPASAYEKGNMIGVGFGYAAMEVLLLVIGPEEALAKAQGWAARAARQSKLAQRLLKLVDEVPALARALGRVGKAGEEFAAAGKAERGIDGLGEAEKVIGRGGDAAAPKGALSEEAASTEARNREAAEQAATKPGGLKLSSDRRIHVLEGDGPGTGTGHGPGRGNTRGAFPDTWTDDQAVAAIERVANSPESTWRQSTGPGYRTAPVSHGGPAPGGPTTTSTGSPVRFMVRGQAHGLNIEVIVEPGGQGIVTGYSRGR